MLRLSAVGIFGLQDGEDVSNTVSLLTLAKRETGLVLPEVTFFICWKSSTRNALMCRSAMLAIAPPQPAGDDLLFGFVLEGAGVIPQEERATNRWGSTLRRVAKVCR